MVCEATWSSSEVFRNGASLWSSFDEGFILLQINFSVRTTQGRYMTSSTTAGFNMWEEGAEARRFSGVCQLGVLGI